MPGMHRVGITAVVNVADDAPPTKDGTWNFTILYVPLKDNTTTNPKWLIDHTVVSVRLLIENGHTVLVHCREGINRAPTICALYLAATENISFAEAWQQVRAIRPQVYEKSRTISGD